MRNESEIKGRLMDTVKLLSDAELVGAAECTRDLKLEMETLEWVLCLKHQEQPVQQLVNR